QSALLSERSLALYHILNREQQIEIPRVSLGAAQYLTLRQAEFEAIPDLRQTANASLIYVADQIRQAGNYKLFRNDSLLQVLSFNQLRRESELTYASNNNLKARLSSPSLHITEPGKQSLEQ